MDSRKKNLSLSKFFKFLRVSLGGSQIVQRPFANLDSSGFPHRCEGILYPENEKEVQTIVKAANRYTVPIYPISTGLNVGYGDGLPGRAGQVILDLRRMNRILEFNEEEGWIRIQSGTSQDAVVEFLKERAPHLNFDMTYWLKEASVIGNALERGRTLFAEREPDLIGAKLISGSGDLLRTGFDPARRSPLIHGLNLHPLIFQSNLGVVVEGILRLRPLDPRARYHLAGFSSFAGFTSAFSRLARVNGAGIRPLRWFCPDSLSRSPLPDHLKHRLSRCGGGTLVFEGDHSAANLHEIIRTELIPIERSVFMTTPSLQSVGQETSLGFVSFTVRRSALELERAQKMVEQMQKTTPLTILQTISFLGDSCQFLLLIKSSPEQAPRLARSQMQKVLKTLHAKGYQTFRNHSALPPKHLPNADLKKMIKTCFDPKGVISPGRYGLQ